MNYRSSNSEDEGSWNEDLWKGLKVEIPIKIQIDFVIVLPFKKVKKWNGTYQLKSDSQLPKKFLLFASWKHLKSDENFFLFHPKSSFRSQYI